MSTLFRKLPCIILCGTPYSDVEVHKNEYANGGIALQIVGKTGEPIATATAWTDGLVSDEVAIKDYSENDGMYSQLVYSGVIQPAHRYARSGFIQFPICCLAEPAGIAGTSKEREMQQKSIKEFISEQLGEDTDDVDLDNYMADGELDELFETGSVEFDLNDEVTIRVVTFCERVSKEPTPEMPDL